MAVMSLALPSPLADAAQCCAGVSAAQEDISFSGLYAEVCLFLVRCLLLPSVAQVVCGEMQCSGWCTRLLPCVLGELLVFVATLAGSKNAPVGGTSGKHVRTIAYLSSQATDSSWALIQVLLCLSTWCREVCSIFLFFSPLHVKEMTLSITFCGMLLGHGSIGTSWLSAAIDDLTQGKLKQELLLFTEQQPANGQRGSHFYFPWSSSYIS